MTTVDLRPLSLGEVLDRTFSLYRQHFVLFVALAGIPRLPVTLLSLVQLWLPSAVNMSSILTMVVFYIALFVAAIAGYLLAQGGTVLAVSELYLGRPADVATTLRRVVDDMFSLLGVVILSGLAIGAATILLIIPGIYVACRLLACVPVAVIEKKGPGESLSRSFNLTQGFAGRAFVVMLFYFAVAIGLSTLVVLPITLIIAANANNPDVVRSWASVQTVLSAIAEALLTPIVLIATSIFYYDLRVRKEAFDLQVMMDPEGANIPRAQLRSVVPEQ